MFPMKILAFDFDGTLTNSFPMIVRILTELYAERGMKKTQEDFTPLWGPDEKGICLRAFGEKEGPKAYQEYLTLYAKYHDEYIKGLTPGMEDLLKELKKKGVKLLLVTGRSLPSTEISFERLHLEGIFDRIYVGSITGVNKPESLLQAERDYNIKPEDLVYVGDSLKDVESCRKAGVKLLSVSFNHTADVKKLEAANPGNVCHSVGELRKKIFHELQIEDK